MQKRTGFSSANRCRLTLPGCIDEEFHLLARDDIKSIGDLSSREVAIDVAGSSTAITATRMFSSLELFQQFRAWQGGRVQ